MRQTILVPLDGSKVGEAALPLVEEMMSKLAPEIEKEIVLLQILEPLKLTAPSAEVAVYTPDYVKRIELQEKEMQEQQAVKYLDRVRQSINISGITMRTKVIFGNAAEEIVRVAGEEGANLIAMSTHGRSGIGRWVFGSITDKVLRHEESVPVLVVRAKKKKV